MTKQSNKKIQEQEIHLRDYYLVLLKHRFLIITCLVLTVAITLFSTLRMEPIYQSTSTLVIEQPQSISPLGKYLGNNDYFSQNLTFNTHFKLITSRPVLERVIRELKLDKPENSTKLTPRPLRAFLRQTKKNIKKLLGRESIPPTAEKKYAQLIAGLSGMIEIKDITDTRLLQISVEDTDPVMARDIANSLAKSYIQFNITNSMEASQNSFQTMQDQSYELQKKLEDTEQEFLKFKQDEQLFSITGKQDTINQRISEYSELAVRNRSELQELTARLNELEILTASNKLDVVRIRSLLNNPVIDKLNEQLITLRTELSKLRKVYHDIHPKNVKVIDSIEYTKKTIRDQVTRELANMKNQQSLLLSKEKNLQNNIADLEQESLDLGQKEVRFAILQRNVDTNQKLYDTLLTKLSESDINESLSSKTVRIAETGQVPFAPIKPNKRLNFLLSIVLGLLGGIGLAFFLEYLDQTIHTEDDVQRYYDLPVLTVVPIANQAGTGYGYGGRSNKQEQAKGSGRRA